MQHHRPECRSARPARSCRLARRLQGPRTRRDIALARARWELFFYCWTSFIACALATAQAAEVLAASIEGRPPHLLIPVPKL